MITVLSQPLILGLVNPNQAKEYQWVGMDLKHASSWIMWYYTHLEVQKCGPLESGMVILEELL